MKNVRGKFRYLILLTILFVGCKDNNLPPPDVELRIISSQSPTSAWTDTLAIFDTPWSKPLDLSNLLTFQNPNDSSESFRLSVSAQEQDRDKEFCLFQFLPTEPGSRVHIYASCIQITDDPYIFNFTLDSLETHPMFIINGIDGTLTAPVTLKFESLDSNTSEKVILNPDEMIKNEPTLVVNSNDLSVSQEKRASTKIQALKISEGNDYQPLVVVRINKNVSFSGSDYRTMTTNRTVGDGFKLYMYTIDPYQLVQ